MIILKIQPLTGVTKELYQNHGTFHEGDAGVDLFFPENVTVNKSHGMLIKLGIKCEMVEIFDNPQDDTEDDNYNIPYMLMPRSSIYKTPLRQSNSIGLIDAGYRGELMVPVDNLKLIAVGGGPVQATALYKIEKGTRLFQLTAPGFLPIDTIEIVDKLSETQRGEGGFGSTGK